MERYFLAIVLTVLVVFSGCDQNPDCNQSTVSGVKFTFTKITKYNTVIVPDTLQKQDGTDSIIFNETKVEISRSPLPVWFHLAGTSDDTIYSTDKELLQFLPLSSGISSISYILNYAEESDEITFYYTENLQFLDLPCGYIASYQLDSLRYSKTFIDTITFISPDANNDVSSENIKIFYY